MQRFKERSGKSFPTYREVLRVLVDLGYRRVIVEPDPILSESDFDEPILLQESTVDA
jgi:cobalamin biosynthesis Co2+ chelatase CbiK